MYKNREERKRYFLKIPSLFSCDQRCSVENGAGKSKEYTILFSNISISNSVHCDYD